MGGEDLQASAPPRLWISMPSDKVRDMITAKACNLGLQDAEGGDKIRYSRWSSFGLGRAPAMTRNMLLSARDCHE
jgi:hypothetical protein